MESLKLISFSLIITISFLTLSINAQNSQQDYLDAHNSARHEVGVADIGWDDTLAAYAQNYANERIGDCNLVHSGGPYGENLFWGSGAPFSGTDAVNDWVSEKSYYDHTTNTCANGQVCGHYTQVVWRSSIHVGCARVQCTNNGGYFIICSYNPPGNVEGESPY
ncbi:pathogenesis-related protein 1C-like [Rutidosis leptorrhynchoides]|uniref:pathogenesis-related protein 1C-like n=1 Tax=Rutidosis leptorrhynchoides TaxID=125765 RepID=UPI003A9933A8